MHIRLQAFAGVLLATLAAGLFAQSQTPGPSSPTGTAAPGIAQPPPRQRPTDVQAVPAAGTGVIRGRVVRADTGQPLRKARVSVRILPRDVIVAKTDASGRYELKGVPSGRYTPVAVKDGFAELAYGRRRPGESGRSIELSDGQTIERIDFALPLGGVIAGRVLDEAGEPLAGATVHALPLRYTQGRRSLVPTGDGWDVTDDLGQFRLFGLAARSYVVSATPPSFDPLFANRAPTPGNLGMATYFPGTLAADDAQPIRVEAGGEVPELTLAMLPVRLAAIVGAVRTSDGGVPPSGAWLTAVARADAGGGNLRPDGTFAMPNLPPGRYTVVAGLSMQSDQVALTEVVLDGADVTVTVTLRKGDTARGRFTFDTEQPPPSLQSTAVRLSADPRDRRLLRPGASGQPPSIRTDWTFEIPGLVGQRRLRATVPEGWAVRSIRVDGRDVTDQDIDFNGKDIDGIVVHLTQQISTIGGLVRDDRGQAVADATVVLFAEDREKWGSGARFVRAVRPEQDGRFTIRGLPAARYLAVALDFLDSGEETNPETLEQLRRLAATVTLADGASATVDLRVTPAP